MHKTLFLFVLVFGVLFTAEPHTVAAQGTGGAAGAGLTGKWTVKADFYGTPLYFQMELKERMPTILNIQVYMPLPLTLLRSARPGWHNDMSSHPRRSTGSFRR